MAGLRQSRRTVYAILAAFLVIDVAALIVLLTPVAGSGAARQQEFDNVRRQVQSKMKVVIPPDQVQERVDVARRQIAAFYNERVPAEGSAISTELGRLAGESRVHLVSARYEELDSDVPGLIRLRVDASITGDYLQEVKFINSLERAKVFFVINSVSLTGAQEPGNVHLTLALETYLKGGAE